MNNNYYDLWVERYGSIWQIKYTTYGAYAWGSFDWRLRLEFMNDLISYFGLSTIESQLCALD
jgi:hypothetical protein